MTIDVIISSFVILLLLALFSKLLSNLIKIPYPTSLVITGFIASELAVISGFDTGVRADNFQQLIFYVLLPVLVFEAAYSIDKRELRQSLFPILFLAIVGMLLTGGLTAVMLFYGIGHASGFPWVAALLTGAILAATDPVSVVSSLREIGAPKRLSTLLEGESLFNDATAIVMFSIFLSMAVSISSEIDAIAVIREFLIVFIGGAAVGIIVGFCASFIQRFLKQKSMVGILTMAVAYGSFLSAEIVHVSGVMATLLAAIIMSSHLSNDVLESGKSLWDVVGNIANSIVFIVMGVTITIGMFEERWLAMLIAVGAVIIARALSVYAGMSLISQIRKDQVDIKEQTVMVWGGLRGAVTLALALSLPTTLEYWWTIQSIAFGVVVFTLFVQAPTIKLLVKALGVENASGDNTESPNSE